MQMQLVPVACAMQMQILHLQEHREQQEASCSSELRVRCKLPQAAAPPKRSVGTRAQLVVRWIGDGRGDGHGNGHERRPWRVVQLQLRRVASRCVALRCVARVA